MTSTPIRFAVHRPPGWRGRLALRPAMVDFAERGFRTDRPATREVLEQSACAFLDGYNRCLDTPYGRPVAKSWSTLSVSPSSPCTPYVSHRLVRWR